MTLRSAAIDRNGRLSDPAVIDDHVCDCCSTDALRLEDGSLLTVYRDRDGEEIRDISRARNDGAGWSLEGSVADDGWRIAACPVNGPALAADGARVAAAWFSAAGDRPTVKAAFSTDGGRTFVEALRLEQDRPQGRVDVEWLEDGSALVSWLEDGALLLTRLDPEGGTRRTWTVAEADSARATGFPRLAVHENGIFLAWTEPGDGGGLRLVRLDVARLGSG